MPKFHINVTPPDPLHLEIPSENGLAVTISWAVIKRSRMISDGHPVIHGEFICDGKVIDKIDISVAPYGGMCEP